MALTLNPVVSARLRAVTERAGDFRYPDTDNQMEDGVFTFAKRTDEATVWQALLARAPSSSSSSSSPGLLALDVGCGLGAHAHALDALFPGALLVDADAGRARAAAARTGFAFGERVFVARIDDDSLAHPDLAGAFAFVQLIQVLGHLPIRSVATALANVRHLLSEDVDVTAGGGAGGGHALLAVPFAGTPRDQFFVTSFDEAAGKVRPRAVEPHEYDALAKAPRAGMLPVRHFTMTSLLSLLSTAQLALVEAKPYHWFSHDTGDLMLLVRRA